MFLAIIRARKGAQREHETSTTKEKQCISSEKQAWKRLMNMHVAYIHQYAEKYPLLDLLETGIKQKQNGSIAGIC